MHVTAHVFARITIVHVIDSRLTRILLFTVKNPSILCSLTSTLTVYISLITFVPSGWASPAIRLDTPGTVPTEKLQAG